MTREIKFRAWDKENKEMCYNDTFDADSVYRSSLASINISLKNNSFEFMQFTSLKDKSGKDIYENDLIDDGCGKVFLVESITPPRQSMYFSYENYDDFMSNSDIGYEIVGNIHENPELLESND